MQDERHACEKRTGANRFRRKIQAGDKWTNEIANWLVLRVRRPVSSSRRCWF